MRKITIILCLLTSLNILGQSPYVSKVWEADLSNGKYKNPILHTDYSDPDVIRVGDDYYMTASSFNCVPGLPILHSKDLVNWRIVNYALQDLKLEGVPDKFFDKVQHGKGVWAPSIRYHNGEYLIYWGDPDFGIYVVKAKDILGVWDKPILVLAGKGRIDPSPLFDDDGKVYLVHAWAGSRAQLNSVMTLCELNADGTKAVGYSGRLENLNVSVYNSGVSIKGSLAKFMYKDNMISLNKKTTKEAINKLSDALNLNIDEAKITELEFGANFLMKHPISMYLDLLKSAPYLEALRATIDTLYFRSKGKTKSHTGKNNKVLCFYDKVKEVEAREGLIPSVYANQNVLRYEVRYNGRLSRQLKTTDITANRLYTDDFYQLMKNNFTNNYNSIVKSNYMMSDEQEIKTVSDALKYMIANSIDEHKARSIMQGLKDRNTLRYPRDYTRLKNKFNEVTSMTTDKPSYDLAKELDDEIKNITAY